MLRRDHGFSQLDIAAGLFTHFEAGFDHLRFPAGAGGKQEVGESRSRVLEHINVQVEIERLKRLTTPQRIALREKRVSPEHHHPFDRIRLLFQNRVIQLVGLNASRVAGGSQRTALKPQTLFRLLFRQEIPPSYRLRGRFRKDHVAALRVELARQRVQRADGAVGLHRIRVLFDPHIGVVARGPAAREQISRVAYFFRRNSGDRLGPRRAVLGGKLGQKLKGRRALHDLAGL